MLYYIKRYPFSLFIILAVVYLSLFRPPSQDILRFPGWDKLVHFCMYCGVSGVLWLEFLLNRRRDKDRVKIKHVVIGAVVLPVVMGGLMEIGQMLLTTYRSGDWLDFLANTSGVMAASLVAWFLLRPLILKNK